MPPCPTPWNGRSRSCSQRMTRRSNRKWRRSTKRSGFSSTGMFYNSPHSVSGISKNWMSCIFLFPGGLFIFKKFGKRKIGGGCPSFRDGQGKGGCKKGEKGKRRGKPCPSASSALGKGKPENPPSSAPKLGCRWAPLAGPTVAWPDPLAEGIPRLDCGFSPLVCPSGLGTWVTLQRVNGYPN